MKELYDKNYICQPKGIPFVAFHKILVQNNGNVFTNLHYHNDFEILYVCKGSIKVKIEAESFVADEDTLIVINPYQLHSCQQIDGEIEYYCLDFDIDMLDIPQKNDLAAGLGTYKNIIKGKHFEELISKAYRAYNETYNGWTLAVKGNLLLVFSALESSFVKKADKSNVFVKSTLKYIEQNISSSITSKTASEVLGYDQSYLCRCVKKHFGITFGKLVNMIRVEKAKNLLLFSSVIQTVNSCGFSSASSFSQIFKKYTGVSPTEYKKGVQNDL